MGFQLPKSSGIFIVMLCAVFAYSVTSYSILSRIVQRADIPERLIIDIKDGHGAHGFSLPVHSLQPMDTLDPKKQKSSGDFVKRLQNDVLFHQNPAFLIWIFLISTMMAICAGSVPFFLMQIRELKRRFGFSTFRVWASAIVYAVLLDLFMICTNSSAAGYYKPPEIINDFHILLNDGGILNRIVLGAILLVLPALTLMFLIGVSSDKIYVVAKTGVHDEATDSKRSIEEAMKRIKHLNQLLQISLQILSVIVVFTVLTSTMLGNSIRATLRIDGFDLYPKQFSYVYGLYFSLFLCVVYVPIYYYLKSNYNKIKELASDPEYVPQDKDWYTSLFGDIKFEGSALENLKLALTIVAPIITSFLPNTFEFLK